MSKQDKWSWWTNAIAGNVAPVHDSDPQAGFFNHKGKPLAIWFDSHDGKLRCFADGKDATDKTLQWVVDNWVYLSKVPVTKEAYDERLETGKWPGESAAVIGHNAAPPDDTLDAISQRIDDLGREAEAMIKAGAAASEATSDQASDLANTLGELEKKADQLRAAAKAPHLEAGRKVDAMWAPLVNRASDLKQRLKRYVVTPFLTKKAEEAQKAAAAAIATGVAPEALPQTRLTAGSTKRATALRTQACAEVTDWDLLVTHLKSHPDIKDAAQRIANASAKAGIELPGMKIIKTRVAA